MSLSRVALLLASFHIPTASKRWPSPTTELLRLSLIPRTLEEVRAQVAAMNPDQRSALPVEWVARLQTLQDSEAIWWLGFTIRCRVTSAVVGQCAFKGPPKEGASVEIAYMIAPEHQGKGYATEAANALAAFAFASGRVRAIHAHTLRERSASTRVLTKCGFEQVGEVVDPEDGLVWRWAKTKRA